MPRALISAAALALVLVAIAVPLVVFALSAHVGGPQIADYCSGGTVGC